MDIVKAIFKRLFAWALAVLTTTTLAVTFQSQNIISRLNSLGGDIGLRDRLSHTFYDLIHLGSLYGVFIAIALAIAFLSGGLIFKIVKYGKPLIYICAGSIAIIVMLLTMKQVFFDVHIIGGARNIGGLLLQMLAGGLGGLVFSKVSQTKKPAQMEAS